MSGAAKERHDHTKRLRSQKVARTFRGTASTLTLLAVLVGCADVKQVGGGLVNSVENAFGSYINESDVCVNQRRDMVEQASLFDQETLGGIALAIGAGVTVGLVSQSLEAGIATTAVALAGLYLAKYLKDGNNPTQVTSAIRSDVRAANTQIDKTAAAFRQIDKCRRNEAKAIRAALRKGTITREVAKTQMAAVKERRQQDIDKFEELAENISQSSAAYASAYNDIAADNGRRGFEISDSGSIKRTRGVARKKNKSVKLAGARKSEVRRLERDCLTNVKKRDEMFRVAKKAKAKQSSYDI